ncbi:transmembrane protein 180-like [Mya arenaria]|uniref:transmembrane protein 180-like n=1 Tax=Mya arenaria TaxID=6604 RepID=UPI0022E2CB86|nr:transmembrane protein 180-like [Mya arenaria]
MQRSARSINSRIFALAALNMGFGMISSSFGFYYVKVFLNIYHIQEGWFQVAQTLFLIWNAINDPLFAYLQDSTNFRFTKTRRESVLYAAPLFALSYLVPWFSWGDPVTMAPWVTGMHLIVALCFWDTMFTYVGLAACCLFTEISKDENERLRMVKYGQIGSVLGSSSILILQYMSDQLENFQAFQNTCIVIAIISCLLMRYCGKHAHTAQDIEHQDQVQKGNTPELKSQEFSYFMLSKQIMLNRDFLAFVVTNFFQEFHRTFLSNFFAIFCDQLIANGAISPFVRSVFYGTHGTLAQLLTILGTPVVRRFGYFRLIRTSQVLSMVLGLAFLILGPINHWCIMAFLLIDYCLANSVYGLFNLPLSDIADKDLVRYGRRHPVTSMVFGSNALVVKPAISLSPMFVVWMLNKYGYEQLNKDSLGPAETASLHHIMFLLLCMYPLVLGCIQFVAWSFYSIREKKSVDVTLLISGKESL